MTKKITKTKKEVKSTEEKNNLSIDVYDINGKEVRTIPLPKEIFAVKVNPKILAQYVRVYLINQRQGNASTKTRGEVTGSTRKIYRQKGTGKARHGDIKAPVFIGGGIVGGPKPRNFQAKLSKHSKKLALFGALSQKNNDKQIIGLVNEAEKIEPKTKIIAKLLKALKISEEKILFILPKLEKNSLFFALRNLPNASAVLSENINAYQILKAKKIIFLEAALTSLEKHFLKNEN